MADAVAALARVQHHVTRSKMSGKGYECQRHSLPLGQGTPESHGWYVVRCAHVDNLFVVEIGNGRTIFLDYVTDNPATRDVIAVEAHGWGWACPPEPSEVDVLWEALTARMRAGDPPGTPDDRQG